ncbi:MAG TPA: NAD(P)-dependent oxidoreductase [Steroidobacteraceae bacterium]|nr:NAD(P)-dependent oxidoreductase [Steroidobacteraceae bacterium]
MRIALIGATGNVGSKILTEALSRGHQVTGIARNVEKLKGRAGVTPKQADLANEKQLAEAIRGHDAVIVSVRHQHNDVLHAFAAAKAAGLKRVVIVGGAASLEVSPGVRLVDTPNFPAEIKVEALPAAEALKRIREEKLLEWSFVSPSIMLVPGERTGKFRLGGDQLLKDAKGDSRISQEDLAVAIIDELEKPGHIRKRFTVGY